MVRVKICGITTVADAQAAERFGADAIGLVFAPSPRKISVRQARRIARSLGPWISIVGVFVDESAARVLSVARECGLSAVQLHGHESAGDIQKLKEFKVLKAFHVDAVFGPGSLRGYQKADAYLFDAKAGDKVGGTGKTFDWKFLKKVSVSKPAIISGGLHPGNVAQAINFFKPYGVDVSSGVEKTPGKKDWRKVEEFIQNAKKVKF